VNVNTVHTGRSLLPQEGIHKINSGTLNTSQNGNLLALTTTLKWQQVPALAVLSIFRSTERVLERLMGLFQTISSPNLRNPYVYYHVHKNLPHAHILSQMNPVHIHPISVRSFAILSSHIRLNFPSGLLPSKPCMHLF
jgi:hypothetical protein